LQQRDNSKSRFNILLPNSSTNDPEKRWDTQRKWSNLGKGRSTKLNFGGQTAELWCPGGEIKFIARMIEQSMEFGDQRLWFTSLVSKKDNLPPLYKILGKARVADFKVVEMAQGQKTSRFIAWTYMKKNQRSLFANRADT